CSGFTCCRKAIVGGRSRRSRLGHIGEARGGEGDGLLMATAHLTVSIQHYSSTGVRVKFLSIQHYYFFLEHEKFQLIDYKKISSIQLFFIYTPGIPCHLPLRG
ncbi:hypothetical protein NR402_16675, partial [Acidithiobacillus ferrooxidans]|uniref:hypothetical protein n=1 Tax=Acidithiobacillus ferrooxidans TaxID=920 RepID=UPI00214BDE96